MKKTSVKKHALAIRRILCALLIISMFSPSLVIGAESSGGVESRATIGTLSRASEPDTALISNDTISKEEALLWKVEGVIFDDKGNSTITLPTGLAADGNRAQLAERGTDTWQPVSVSAEGIQLKITKPEEEVIVPDFELMEEKGTEAVTDTEEDMTDSKKDTVDTEEDTTASEEDDADTTGDVSDLEEETASSGEVTIETVYHSLPMLYSSAPAGQEIKFMSAEGDAPEAEPDAKATEPLQTEYVLSIPCKINKNAIAGGMITIAGLTLQVSDAAGEGGRAGGKLKEPVMTLYKDKDMTEELTGEISLKDSLHMQLLWDDIIGVDYTETYEYELPAVLTLPVSVLHEGTITIDGAGAVDANGAPFERPIATWKVTDKKISIQFHEETFYVKNEAGIVDITDPQTTADLTGVTFAFACRLNEGALSADDEGKITVSLPGGKEYDITVTEKKPAGAKLEKTAAVLSKESQEGKWSAEWTVTYTAPSEKFADAEPDKVPTQLKDTLPLGLEYIDGSFNCTKEGSADGSITVETQGTPTASTSQKIMFNIDVTQITPGAVYTLKYQTQLTDAKLFELWKQQNKPTDEKLTNTVVGMNKDSGIPDLKASSDVKLSKDWEGRTLLSKGGVLRPDKSTGKYYLDWTITVHTAGSSFTALAVEDTLGKSLKLDENSIHITDGKNDLVSGTDYTVVKEENTGVPTKLTIHLIQNGDKTTGIPAKPVYIITYTTEVPKEYFTRPDDDSNIPAEDVSNNAKLISEWPDGKGPENWTPPEISKGPGSIPDFTNNLVKKEAVGYYPAERKLTWEVTVNPRHVDLQEIILTEDLTQSIYAHSFSRAGVQAQGEITIETAKENLKEAVENALKPAGIQSATVTVEKAGDGRR